VYRAATVRVELVVRRRKNFLILPKKSGHPGFFLFLQVKVYQYINAYKEKKHAG